MKNVDEIELIRKQFLCNVPIQEINWKCLLDDVSYEAVTEIIEATTNSTIVLNFPIKVSYQTAFLKHIISELEKQDTEIPDLLYEAYGRLVALPSQSVCFKHYVLNGQDCITLKENINFISEGTTGLQTWQAALALSEWSLSNKNYFHNKTILELGSGIGLTGLVLSLFCNPNSFYFTDCHPSVLNTLVENIKLNVNKSKTNEKCAATKKETKSPEVKERILLEECVNSTRLRVLNLPWQEVTSEFCGKIGNIDLIVAADIVYDSDLFDPLIAAINYFQANCGVGAFIFACTERNANTLKQFLTLLVSSSFEVRELEVPNQNVFLWSNETPVKIFSFEK